MFFSAVQQPGEPSLPLRGACAMETVGCLCALHFGDACHEHVQLVLRGLKNNKHRELEKMSFSRYRLSCVWSVLDFHLHPASG